MFNISDFLEFILIANLHYNGLGFHVKCFCQTCNRLSNKDLYSFWCVSVSRGNSLFWLHLSLEEFTRIEETFAVLSMVILPLLG